MKLVNPFTQPGRWYKANFHTHTTVSDGQLSPQAAAAHYRRHGYSILALTDHDRMNDVDPLMRKNFLVINGFEHGATVPGRSDAHHLVALNVPPGFVLDAASARDANAFIRSVKAAGGETLLAHPHWCGHRYDQHAYIQGYAAIEVFNSTCEEIGRPNSEADWTQLLDAGRVLPAVAVDDAHAYPRDACRGWVWMKLEKLAADKVMQALRSGCFFSSTGPRILDFQIRAGRIALRCSPARAVYFIAHQPLGGAAFRAEGGKPIRSVEMALPPDWISFRAVVVDHSGNRAWSNPIVLGSASCADLRGKILGQQAANWKKRYRLAARASGADWLMLELAPLANRALYGDDAWIGTGLQLNQIPAGIHHIQGVPFRIVDQAGNGGKAALALKSAKMPALGGKPIPESFTIPVNRKCKAVYFLHGAGFLGTHEQVAEYSFVYADGARAALAVLGLGHPVSDRRTMAQRERASSIQDWWPACRHFEHEHARRVIVVSPDNPAGHRALYSLEWINPHPKKVVKAVRLRSRKAASPVIVVLAVTVLG